MDERPAETPATLDPPFGTFEKVVRAIVAGGGEKLRILELTRQRAVLLQPQALGAVRIVCVRFEPERTDEKTLRLELAANPPLPVDLVLVGGDQGAWKLLKRARPFYTPNRVGLVQLDDRLELRAERATLAGKLLSPAAEKIAPLSVDPESWSELLARSAASRAAAAEERVIGDRFATLFKQRRPFATWAIAVAIAIVFALQLYLGGSDPTAPLLIRMGALARDRVFGGEWWRLLSCTFLHGGPMHVLLNVYVLVVLGSFLERIIGTARFLILYLASAIAGSLGSALLLKAGFSVGASGAVWGLLGAHAFLAYRSRGLLPDALLPGARRAALINLGLNVVNSFRPHVDLWAHFAGGAAGALIFASGLLTRGLPPLSEDAAAARPVPTPRGLWLLGGLAALLLVAGPSTAILVGKPQQLREPAALEVRKLPELGVALAMPAGLPERMEKSPAGPTYVFGDVMADPATVAVFALPLPPLDAAARAQELAGLTRSLELPKGAKLLAAPASFPRGADLGLAVSYSFPSKLVLERAFLFLPGRLVRVEVLRWPQLDAAAPPGLARRLVESARVL